METGIQNGTGVQREVVAGIKVIESVYRVDKPIFQDVKVDRAIFVDKQVDVPVGMEKVIIAITNEIVTKVLEKIDAALIARLKQIEVPKIIYKEEVNIITKDVQVNNAIITDVLVNNAVLQDYVIKNVILEDVAVLNPVLVDTIVVNAILKERIIINPIFEDVVIQRPKFVEKEIVVIHPKYIDMKGNPE